MIGKCNTGGGENLTTQLNNQDAIITELESKVQSVSGVDMATPVNAQTATIEDIQQALVDKGAVNQVELTVTPGKDSQEYTPENGTLYSKVTVNGDADLIPDNIKSGVNIFGVDGNVIAPDITSGTLTIVENISNQDNTYSVEHGLGKTPSYYGVNGGLKSWCSPMGTSNGYVTISADATCIYINFKAYNKNCTINWVAIA